eukprot:m.29930 g.29930  ORF g.29930 m.29930 type:complete len:267 (-) comp11988_c0_seq1:114-914(-)
MKDRSTLVVDSEPLLVGTLSKRAQGKSTFGRLNWKHRWFVLYNNKLEWWSSEGGRYNSQSECKGSVDLSTVHAVEHVSYDAFTKAHMFQIVHTSLLYIQCNTKAECTQWVETLRQLIRVNTFLHPKYHPGFFEDKDRVWSCCGIPNKEFKGCLGAFDYSQLPDRPVHVPSATEPVIARPEPASATTVSASKPLAVAKDSEASSVREAPAAKPKEAPAVLKAQENQKRAESGVEARFQPPQKRNSAELRKAKAPSPVVVRPAKVTYV